MKSLSIHDLSYAYYKNDMVIHDMTMNFEKNKIHTLLGLNGSGKTTLIQLLAGLFAPKKGSVFLDGRDLKDIDYLERSQYISYVRQGTSTGDDHFVKDYLSFGMMNKLSWYQSPKKEHLQIVEDTARKFQIGHLLDKRMNELSGGQKQIVMICRAFIQNTDIIILDEPTSALDFKNQSLVLKQLKDIVDNNNKTIIFSTHNPNHALFLNSYVTLIHEGRILETGPANELIRVDKLRSVYGDSISYSTDLDYQEVSII